MWIIVVEPYFDGSHRAWAQGYQRHSDHDIDLATHRGSFWKWRMQGGAVTLAREVEDLIAERGRPPDALIVSDMVDVAALRGFLDRRMAGAPVVAYFHENQMTYPLAPGALPDVSYGIRNWISMAAADEVWFNSAYHLDQVARALPVMLGAMPDHTHTHLGDGVMSRAIVQPVGIDAPQHPRERDSRSRTGPPMILWNQRWEYDKDPGRFFAAVDRAAERGLEFSLAVCGQNFRRRPTEFAEAALRHRSRLTHLGEAEPAAYRELLARADVVVSTARHEFFGLAVAEAVAAGAFPVLPDELAYPELIGPEHAEACLYSDDSELDAILCRAITEPGHTREVARDLARSVRDRFDWPVVARGYDRRMEALVGLSS